MTYSYLVTAEITKITGASLGDALSKVCTNHLEVSYARA